MRLITKLWATLLLLCVAGVANAAKGYEVDQKFSSVAALNGQLFAIVNETDSKAIYNKDNQNLAYDTYTNAVAGAAYLFKLHSLAEEGIEALENAYAIEAVKADGSSLNVYGQSPIYLNSGAEGGFDGCFVLGNGTQYGTDVLYGGAWEIEYDADKGYALKNVARGGYFAGVNPAPTGTEPIYWTFCTLKEGADIPDPEPVVIPEPEAPLGEGELIPDFFSICDEGGIPYGYDVKFGSEDRAYPTTYTGGARIFNFAEGGDFTKAIYYREGYVQYGNVKKLALEAGKKYIIYFNSAMWKDSGATLKFTITKEGEETALVDSIITNAPNVNGAKDAVTGSTRSEIEFTPEADGNYILKWDASGWKEVLLANVGVKVAPAVTPTPTDEPTIIDWVAGDQNYTNQQDLNGVEIALDAKTTMTCAKGTGSTTPKYYTTGSAVRTYGGNTITFKGEGITKIIITGVNGKVAELTASTGELTKDGIITTWKGEANEIVLTNSTSDQQHIAKLHVVYGGVEADIEPVHIANTAETAYTVAKAIELIDAGDALDDTVFVKGIICQVDTFIEKYKSISYWISEDGTTNGAQFECYSGKDINGADFASIDDVKVGAEVIVTGLLTKYKETYEFKANNELVSYKAPFKPLFADGKYYIYNVGAQKYLAAGANWGTHAVVNADGLDYIITATDGKYTLDSQVSNGGNNHFLNGEWNDGAAMGWTFAPVEGAEGVYTISDGTNFLTAQDNGEVTLAADATAAAAQWTLKTLEARIAELATATAEAPVNATFLIQDANFCRNDLRKSAWTIEASNQNLSGGNNTNNNAESYHSVFTLSQVLTNVPKGVYTLTAQGFYRQDGEDNENLPVFFANDYTQTFPLKTGSENSMSDASASFSNGNYTIDPIYFQLTEAGDLTVGAKLENNANLWCIWDNFQLTYYGVDADLEAVKNAAIIKELADLCAKAEALKAEVEVDAVKTAIDEALGATAEASGADAINTAIATMKAVIEKADVHIAAKAALDGMANVMAGTNVYTAEAFETYNGIYETAKGKYQAGELTKDDVIENPEAQMGWHTANTVDDLLLSVWTIGETQCKDYDAGMYINTWSVEGNNDGSNFKVPFFEYWTGDGESLGENKLTATMSNLEPGTYDVTAWVRVRAKNGYTAPAYGISLQANDGEAVDVAAGDQIGESQFYLKEFTARGTVAEDGVLKIQFNVAADNNISWLSFKNVKFEKYVVEVAHTWNFTKWSEATVANLKAEAAKGYTEGLWSDSEKADGSASTMEISKDNCFWQVGTSAAEGETLTANGEEIAELKGLIFKNNKARSLAIAVNYGDCTSANGEGFGPYHGASYLWLGSKNVEYFTIPAVKAGSIIKMGVESHKFSDARGVQLLINGEALTDPAGNAVAAPTTYTEQFWQVPAGDDAVDVVVKNTNGCHIYFIDLNAAEEYTTAISTVKTNKQLNGTIFNLNGQKVNKAQKGLYIINGKKVVVK